MSTSEVSPETPLDKGQRAEAAIPTNVRVYLGLSGKTQKALGEALGITKSAMSMKMCGKVGWSVSDLVTTAAEKNKTEQLDMSEPTEEETSDTEDTTVKATD